MPDKLVTWAREAERQPFDAAAWNRLPNWQNGNLIAPSKLRTDSGILGSEWDPSTPLQTMRVNTRFFNNTTGIGETTDDLDFRMFNTRWLSGRNFGDTATVNMLRLNGSDQIELGAAANDVNVLGPAFFKGNVTLGDAAADLISVLGTLTVTPLATFLDGIGVTAGGISVTAGGILVTAGGISITLGGLAFAASTPGQRITGDMSNATVLDRLLLQTSTVNGNTLLSVIPNGSGTNSTLNLYGTSTPTASASLQLQVNATETRLLSTHTGAAFLPLRFYNNNASQMEIAANGDITIAPAAGKIGLFGTTPVVQQTVAAAATDLATVITLANSLRTGLRALGAFA